jgi:hypothetical protein
MKNCQAIAGRGIVCPGKGKRFAVKAEARMSGYPASVIIAKEFSV